MAGVKPIGRINRVSNEEYIYGGENSLAEIEKIAKLMVHHSLDAVIGVGGGKVLI